MARSTVKTKGCFEAAIGLTDAEARAITKIAEGKDFKTTNTNNDYYRATAKVLEDAKAQRGAIIEQIAKLDPQAAQAYAAPEQAGNDDLDAMFDEIVAQESVIEAPKEPRAPRAPRATSDVPETGFRKTTTPRAPSTATQAAKSAVKNAASGIGNTIDALGALFSTKPGTLGSGPVFNEDTYAAAKPLFAQAVADLKASGQDIREVMQAVIRMVMAKFGGDTVAQMKPYIVKFTQDVRDGLIDVSQSVVENGETNGDTENKENQDDSGIEGESAGALDELSAEQVGGTGGRGSRGSGANGSRNSRRKGHSSVDGEGGKAGRGRGNGTAEPDLFATGEGGDGVGQGKSGGVGPDGGPVSGNEGQGSEDRQGSRGGIRTGSGEVIPAAVPATNFVITPDLQLGVGGEVAKYNGNLAAIRTLKTIESEHRRATPDEQRILAKFVGWGGLSKAFRNRLTGEYNKEWLPRVQELEALLTPAELKAASASTPNAHYTSETVTGFMWRAAKRLGFGGGMALESSVGSGNFIGLMPEHVRAGTFLTGIELDGITARIAGALYPQSNIVHSAFEKVALPDNTFDLNIGNPPFGNISLRMKYNPKHNGKSIHNQFFLGGMDALKPGGLQTMVVSRYLMDAQDASTREALALKAELLGAIRLPGSAFKGNAGTEVVTDILFLKKRTAGEQAELQDLWNSRNSKPPAKESYSDRAERLAGQARLAQALEWTKTTSIPDPLGGDAMVVSQYFADNPHMIAGVMDRSGSMQFGKDIDVKLPASELEAKLDSLMAQLPGVKTEHRSDEVNARTEAMHKALGESMSIMASGREIGSIYYDESGDLTEITEKVDEQGKTVVSKMKITAQSPWSGQLSLNMDGKWFKEVAALDEKGEKVKVGVKINPKTGKPTPGRNLYVREVYQNDSDVPSGMRLGEEGFAKLQRLVAIRELYVQQINLETNSAQPEVMEANRAKLRAAYEGFVADHGYINEQKNASIVSDMPDEGLLLSLELKYRPAVTAARAKAKGIKASPARAEPNAILTRAVSIPPARKDSAASISDAVAIVLGEMGRIDVPRVAQLRAISEEQAIKDMTEGDAPIAYVDPETREITEKNQYLSGNVRKKLAAAIAANMQTNIKALEAVQPEPWTSDKVTTHMGATWVPPNIYADFVKHLLGRDAKVTFSPLTNLFEVIAPGATAVDSSKWGTERAKAVDLLNAILNNTRIAIYDGGYRDVPRVLNETDTQSAIDKKKELLEEFDNWIFKDGDRRQELTQLFNDLYNTRVNRQYDGAHMEFPGKVPDSIIKFRRNQINAVWRGIVDRFVMYDHAVGAGKTFTGISRAIERRRMGLSNKPAVVVPNHLVSEWATQAYRLYPGAKILAASEKDLEPKNRRRLFAKIAAGDWDLVIVPHSSFKFIGISPDTEERFINDELRVANAALKEAEDDAEPGQRFKPLSVKAAEALILKLENRMDVVRGKAGKDQLLTFEQMGIDDLTVDESHEFKNLTYSTRLTDVRGLGPAAGSQKAFDLYTKMRILHETNGSAAFLTGTPISNSAVEMYTIMRYLAPSVLQESGLEHFDAFRAQYVQASEKHEPTEAGNGLKVVNRLGRNWSNMRSLMDGYYSVADVVTNDDIKAWFAEDNPGMEFPMPNVKGGGRRTVKADPTPTQQRLIQEVIDGYNGLPNIKDVQDRNKERLRLMDRARKLALHAKVWDRSLTDEPGGKLDMVVDEAMRLYKQWGDHKGTQLIFLDRSVPKSQGDDKTIKAYDALRAKLSTALENDDEKGQREAIEALESYDTNEIAELRAAQAGGWNAYQYMADGLIAKGVPKEQIAFIQNYSTDLQKKALFEAVNDGTIRFLSGSSQRMGAGMNVQERLVGLHHVDVSWKPADIEQREGRIIRQGNRLAYNEDGTPNIDGFEVEIMAYVTERSMDAKMWDLNSTKLRMVNGIRYYDGEFEMDFEDDDAIDMAEIAAIASGDPLMLERIKLTSTLEDLYRKRRSYDRRVQSAEDSLRRAERNLVELPIAIAKAKAIAEPVNEAVMNAQADQLGRSVTVDGQKFASLESALGHAEEQIKIKKDGDEKAPFTLDVDGTPLSSVDKVREAIADKMGDVAAFVAELGGKKVIRRATVAREIRALIGTEFRDMAPTTFGSMYGFRMTVSSDYGRLNSHNVNLSVTIPYAGKVETVMLSRDISPEKHKSGQAVPVLTSSLRAVVDQLATKIEGLQHAYTRGAEEDLASAKENIPTYREAMKEKFKFADELDAANTRLDEVQDILAERADAKKNAPAAPAVEDEVKSEDGEAPALSRATKPATGLPVSRVKAIMGAIKATWKNAPDIVVAESMDDEVIPANVRAYNQKQMSLGATGAPQGFIYGGKVYLIADQLDTPGHVVEVLFHEALGHIGLRGVFGKSLDQVLNQVILARRSEVLAKAKQYGLSASNPAEMRQAAEEVLASLAQEHPNLGLVKRAIAAIRTWLRENIPQLRSLHLTDEEIVNNFILPARRFIIDGSKRGGTQAATGKSSRNGALRDANYLANVVVSEPFRNKGLRGLNIPEQRIVLNSMVMVLQDLKIRNAVVELIPVNMMNNLVGGELSSKVLLDDPSVLKHISAINSDNSVPRAADIASSLVRATAFVAAEQSFGVGERGLSGSLNTAIGAFKRHLSASMSSDADVAAKGTASLADMVGFAAESFSAASAGKIDDRHVVTPTSDGVLGDVGADTPSSPPIVRNTVRNTSDDASNPDIRFSRSATLSATANKVVDKLNEHFSHAGTMHWWHKSFGSPYNLAQKSRPFKRVFTSAQDFLNDVSFYANEAADHAAKLLPKLENLKDIGKSPISAADNKAIEAPIFEGTLLWARDEAGKPVKVTELEDRYADLSDEDKGQMLMKNRVVTEAQLKRWKASQLDIYSGAIRNRFEATYLRPGVEWTDAELKSIFNLTPEQADLYHQFHAAVGTSLDNMAKSEMLRYGGKDVADLRDMVLDAASADDAAILLRDHLLELSDEEPDRSSVLTDMANGMIDRADKVNKLKKEGYAPLSRFGQYSVDVVVDGERQYFGLFETKAEANQMAKTMRDEFGADNVESGTVAQAKFEQYKGITPESLELFGNMLGLDSTGDKESDKAFQEYLKLTKNNRSAMKRLIHRKGIAGYSTDTGRVLAAFIYSNARQTAAGLHMGEMSDALNAIHKTEGQLSDYATKYADYVKNPQEEAQAIRGLMFAQYLGGNVASAFVNFTQPMTVSFPYLSQFGGVKGAAAAIGKAMADQSKRGFEYEDGLKEALRIADEQGVTQPQSVHELQAQARGAATLRPGDGTRRGNAIAMASNGLSKLSLGWGKLFGMAEQINRRTTFIAAYRIAVEKGIANPGAFATKAVDETQFINNKGNKAVAARGAIGSTMMTFKSYSINYMELLHRMAAQGGPEGKRAVALAMVMLFLMAGAGGLPFMDDLDDLIDGIAQRMGYNFSSKKAKQEFLEHWIGKAGAQFVDRGITGIAGIPIDIAGRMGMGNLLPGTGLFMPKADHTSDMAEFLGVAADLGKRASQAGGQLLDGHPLDAALSIAPKAIGNLAQGARMMDKGYYQDAKGSKVIDTTPTEAAFKAIGFQPQSVAKVGESNWIMQSAKNVYNLKSQAIRAQWAKGIFENDPAMVESARSEMQAWNEKNPGQRITPNMPAIIRKVKEMRKTKEARIADTSPKAMRAQVRRDIAESHAE